MHVDETGEPIQILSLLMMLPESQVILLKEAATPVSDFWVAEVTVSQYMK